MPQHNKATLLTNDSNAEILVLDDDLFTLTLHARMLTNMGFRHVATRDNAEAALEPMTNGGRMPRLILCDLNMPGMDGIEFLRKLVALGYRGSLILVSGEDQRILQSARTLALAHHFKLLGCFQKPVTPEMLGMALENWIPEKPLAPRHSVKRYSCEEIHRGLLNGEFFNHYQPKVSISSGAVVGLEALVRWRHPVDGMVPPDQFVHLTETHRLIDMLTETVLAQAVSDAARWARDGLALNVAINVSMMNLTSLDFPELVSTAAEAAGVNPQSLTLEVTETKLVKDLRKPLDILTRLRLRRFHLSIDDFGTGHSTLAQLHNLPFDELKIDQSFVHGAHNSEIARTIFMASLHLAQELGLDTVAEGIEDLQDWQFVRQTDCALAQGYFIARPMPAREVANWMTIWEQRLSAESLLAIPNTKLL